MATGIDCTTGDVDPAFTAPELNASVCSFSIKLPNFTFGFVLPTIPFPPSIPFPTFGFALICDPADPIDVSAGLEYGGGRISCVDADPDLTDV